MEHKARRQLAYGGVLVVTSVCWVVWMRWSPLERQARNDAEAIISGDVSRLLSLATPEERAAGLDLPRLRAIYDISVKGRMANIASKGDLTSLVTGDNGSSAVAKYPVRLTNGRHFYLGLQVFNSESGAKASIAQTLTSIGWQLEYISRPGYFPRAHDIVRSTLAGIRSDRERLEAAGVLGLYNGTARGFMTWDKLEATALANLARDEARDGSQGVSSSAPAART